MQRVFVLDKNKKSLMPCHPARARQLLKAEKAAVYRCQPFTIILKEREGGVTQPIAVKIDPGSKTTGMALVVDFKQGKRVIWAAEITHKGMAIKMRLESRRALRRGRRSRKLRYRPARWRNRRQKFAKRERAGEKWLPPSLNSRIDNITSWVSRLRKWCPISDISVELVRFDTQKMQNPEISGVEYQQGTLLGYEVREYLLEHWGRRCAYCGAENIPLEIEHIIPKSRGGSNRVNNLTISCHKCNQMKGAQTATEFGFPKLQPKQRASLYHTASVNATRWVLFEKLKKTGLPVECGTGGRTKFNRTQQKYPKTHWADAACVGESGEHIYIAPNLAPLLIKAIGRGKRKMRGNDRYGFPRGKARKHKRVHDFQTGDLVRADVPRGKNIGTHVGRVTIRATGSFHVGKIDGISWRYCQKLQCSDGYEYKIK